MNKDNYCSLEAAQKLADAGIVLETDCVYNKYGKLVLVTALPDSIPAPSMAELWRELPESITKGGTIQYLEMGKTGSKTYAVYDFADEYVLFDNPTDALIDLLVWLKGEGK